MTNEPPKPVNPILGLMVLGLFAGLAGTFIWVYLNYFQPRPNPTQQAIAQCTDQLAEAAKGSGIPRSKHEQECTLMYQSANHSKALHPSKIIHNL